jgi:acetyl esterase/lipase
MAPLAADLAARGLAAWNVEYRGVGRSGGGWPGTLDDVGAAGALLGATARANDLDPDRVVIVGHSAGGQLALWLAARLGRAGPPAGVVSQAGVLDLVRAQALGLGAGAVEAFLGGTPTAVPDRYAVASPAHLLPVGAPQLVVHGVEDDTVPQEMSRRYAADAELAGDPVELLLPRAGHMELIDPAHSSWAATMGFIIRAIRGTAEPGTGSFVRPSPRRATGSEKPR